MENPKFQIYQGGNDQFYFRLKARNGETILGSDSYMSRQGCERGVFSVQRNGQKEQRFQKLKTSNDMHYFIVKARNGQTVGVSELYKTESGRNKGINSVIRASRTFNIESY